MLSARDYADAVEDLGADIIVGLGDIPYGRTLGSKRVQKAADRVIQWSTDHVNVRKEKSAAGHGEQQARLFAPLLPVSCANQQFYIDCLADDLEDHISGLAFYDLATLEDLPQALQHLPRIGFTEPGTPHQLLRHIDMGIDLHTVPFISAATDAGVALGFTLPAAKVEGRKPLPLGEDMWLATHAADLSPLTEGCTCYACTNHHRAYVQHLLAAKEMLGWVLLQIHNHHVMDLFFDGVRRSISERTFHEEVARFERVYESALPEGSGQGPRVRGYQYKSEGPGEVKKNKAPFTKLNDRKEVLAESAPPSATANATELEQQGFAEKQ